MSEEIKLTFDKEFQTLIPPLTKEEFTTLEESITNEGCRDPLVIWDKVILDGHNRYNICMKHGLIFKKVEKNFDNRELAKIWILENQLGRRNLNEAQRIDVVDKLFGLKEKEDAKQRQGTSPGGKGERLLKENLPEAIKGQSRDKLGKKAKVSGRTYSKGINVKKNNSELWQQCLDGKVSIDKASKQVDTDKKEQKRKEKSEEGEKIELKDIDFRHGDFTKVLNDIPDDSVDLILTDPPYPYKFIECWSKLAEFASKKLKPNGFCIAYSGQMFLPEVMNRLGKHLEYYWIFCLYHKGGTKIISGRNIMNRWKPVLFYQKKPLKKISETVQDYVISEQREKKGHDWQQSVSGISSLIEYFSNIGDIVCDPFVGSGTTLYCAKKLKRKCIGAEIDKDNYNRTKERLQNE